MGIFILERNGNGFTIPIENLRALALYQAIQWGYNKPIDNTEDAIEFFKSKGFTVRKEESDG